MTTDLIDPTTINKDDIVVKKWSNGASIVIPMCHWSNAGKYAWITFDKPHNIVSLRPTIVDKIHYRSVQNYGNRYYISISSKLVEIFDNDEAVFHSENGRVEIHLRNPIHMKAFELWGKSRSGKSLSNSMDLRISNSIISISSTIWPIKGQYVTVGYNGKSLFLKPVLIKTPDSLKVQRVSQRFRVNAVNFFKATPVFQNDWRLMETLPDGTLRFSPWGKGHKHAPKAINPVIDHPTEPQTIKPTSQEGDFGAWLSENWQDEE